VCSGRGHTVYVRSSPGLHLMNYNGYSQVVLPMGDGREILHIVPVDGRILMTRWQLPEPSDAPERAGRHTGLMPCGARANPTVASALEPAQPLRCGKAEGARRDPPLACLARFTARVLRSFSGSEGLRFRGLSDPVHGSR